MNTLTSLFSMKCSSLSISVCGGYQWPWAECDSSGAWFTDRLVKSVYPLSVPPGNPIIESREDIVREGNETEITCTSMGSKPAATIRWMKGDKELQGGSSHIVYTQTKQVFTRFVFALPGIPQREVFPSAMSSETLSIERTNMLKQLNTSNKLY